MFDFIKQNNEKKDQFEFEKRDREFTTQRDLFHSPSAQDDSVLMQVQNERSDLVRWQQALDDDIELLKHDLLLEELTDKGWVRQTDKKPLINDDGVYLLITLVKRYLNRNSMMSSLSEEIVKDILLKLSNDLVLNLMSQYKEFGINPLNLSLIKKMVINSVEFTLYRALNNGERKYLNTINKRIETYSENSGMDSKQKSFLRGMI